MLPFPTLSATPNSPASVSESRLLMEVLSVILVMIAVLAGAVGLLLTSEATLGVAIIALGCLAGILARLAQAAWHRNDYLKRRQRLSPFERQQQ